MGTIFEAKGQQERKTCRSIEGCCPNGKTNLLTMLGGIGSIPVMNAGPVQVCVRCRNKMPAGVRFCVRCGYSNLDPNALSLYTALSNMKTRNPTASQMAFTPSTLLLAVTMAMFLIAAIYSVHIAHAWVNQGRSLAMATLGFLLFVFAEDVSDYGGRYGWTRTTWRSYPSRLTKSMGLLVFVVGINKVFHIF
jgi:hypothetical protein